MNFSTYLTELAEMNLVGSAIRKANHINLTPAKEALKTSQGLAGAAWWPYPLILTLDFEIQINFAFANPGGKPDFTGIPGGDGLALVFQNYGSHYLGGPGAYLGYDRSGISAKAKPSPLNQHILALEVDAFVNNDTYQENSGKQDVGLVQKHLAFHYRGCQAANQLAKKPLPNLGKKLKEEHAYEEHSLRLYYRANDGLMVAWMDEGTQDACRLDYRFKNNDLKTLIGQGKATGFVGITGSTYTAWQDQMLLDFQIKGITVM
ncbi:MAG TPA: hypothetical protein DCE41_32850 [Cytophagales bacterium]|nr:hypothetical protein [Cytophagales bacterium]